MPFRHDIYLRSEDVDVILSVSITFRLSALSARHPSGGSVLERGRVSITFRLSALSALVQCVNYDRPWWGDSLNYLSAQCPFGTTVKVTWLSRHPMCVSITFRLSALSAPWISAEPEGSKISLNYLSAQCPFGTKERHGNRGTA